LAAGFINGMIRLRLFQSSYSRPLRF